MEGNWVVKRAAGSTPAILGTKLKQHHFRGDNYLETDLEIGACVVIAFWNARLALACRVAMQLFCSVLLTCWFFIFYPACPPPLQPVAMGHTTMHSTDDAGCAKNALSNSNCHLGRHLMLISSALLFVSKSKCQVQVLQRIT